MDFKFIGKNIKKRRKVLGLTQEKASEMIDISASFYSHIENGSRHAGVETFVKIAECFDISLDYIFFGDESEIPEYDDEIVALAYRINKLDKLKKDCIIKIIDAIEVLDTCSDDQNGETI